MKKRDVLRREKKISKMNLEMFYLDKNDMTRMFKISESTLNRWIAAKIFKCTKIKSKNYYPFEFIEQYMRANSQ